MNGGMAWFVVRTRDRLKRGDTLTLADGSALEPVAGGWRWRLPGGAVGAPIEGAEVAAVSYTHAMMVLADRMAVRT